MVLCHSVGLTYRSLINFKLISVHDGRILVSFLYMYIANLLSRFVGKIVFSSACSWHLCQSS